MSNTWRAWSVEKSWRRNDGPQVVVKVAGRRKSAAGVKACLRYVVRLRPADLSPVPLFNEFGAEVDPLAGLTTWDLLADTENLSRKARGLPDQGETLPEPERLYHTQLHHFIVSARVPVGDESLRSAFWRGVQAGVDELFAAKGFQVLWAVHDDAAFLHAHVLVKAQSRFGPRLRLDIHGETLDQLRQVFAEVLTQAGVSVQAVRREDRGELREEMMSGRTFVRWPRRPGNGDLSCRAPAWFARHGGGLVQRRQPREPEPDRPRKSSWWRQWLPWCRDGSVPSAMGVPVDPLLSDFSVLYHEPLAAQRCWRELAAGEGGRGKLALASWYLRRQPEIFGATKPHAPEARENALTEVRKLPLLSPLPPVSNATVIAWGTEYGQLRQKRRLRRNRVTVVKSLWHLARRCAEVDDLRSVQVILGRVLSGLHWPFAEMVVPWEPGMNEDAPPQAAPPIPLSEERERIRPVSSLNRVPPVLDVPKSAAILPPSGRASGSMGR
ncbi:hypothetical protein [Magnetospirillum gryphiswaldense]|nr:hypothetical protein [Magnetospirillum gryphiswaldense]